MFTSGLFVKPPTRGLLPKVFLRTIRSFTRIPGLGLSNSPEFQKNPQTLYQASRPPRLKQDLLSLRSTPHPVTVTTRIITFLVGNPYKPSFATVTGWGVDPNYPLLNYPTW